jgi:hypothetical protein
MKQSKSLYSHTDISIQYRLKGTFIIQFFHHFYLILITIILIGLFQNKTLHVQTAVFTCFKNVNTVFYKFLLARELH